MKQVLFIVFLFISSFCIAQASFNGNGKNGFGGAIGTGNLQISDNGTTISFIFTKGSGFLNDALVLYIDSKAGGFSTTSGFNDALDGLRKAISGVEGGGARSTLTFPAGFTPDYAIAFDQGFGGAWELAAGGNNSLVFLTSVNLTPTGNNSPTYSFSINKSTLGITGGITFNFLGTYISNTGFRSDEAIGDPMTGFSQGYNNHTITSFNTYSTSPVVTTSAGNTAFTYTAVAVDPAITVSDPNSTTLTGASVSITNNFSAGDQLNFVNTAEISHSYDAGTGVLTLIGTATVVQYQTALRSITYSTSSTTPSTADRTVSFIVTDGTFISNTATKTLTVGAGITSNATDNFRSGASGNWITPGTWLSAPVGQTIYYPATLSPTTASNSITIQNSHTVSIEVSDPVTVDQTTIEAGGTLRVAPGATLNVVDDAGDDLVNNGTLLFASDATGTGRLGAILSGTTITGNATVERFLSGAPAGTSRRNFFVASPVSALLSEAWQQQIHITGTGNGGAPCTTNDNSQPGKHTNGFDATQTNNPSMFTYNTDAPAGSRYTAISSTNSFTLNPGFGYRVLVRGPRSQGCALLMDGSTTQGTVTLSATGLVTIGDKDQGIQGNGFTLLGNPYPCEINFDDATFLSKRNSAGIDNAYWTYNPVKPIGTGSANTYTSYSNGTVTNGPLTNGGIIAQGQAFFVHQTAGADANVTNFWQEGYKTTTNQPGLFRTAAPAWKGFVRAGLKDANDSHLDEIVVRFIDEQGVSKDFSNQWDARSFNDGTAGIAGIKGSTRLAIQTRPATFTEDVAPLRVTSSTPGNFKLSFTEINFAGTIQLKDKFTNTLTDVKANPVYAFSITSDAASQGDNRFELVFGAASVLPVDFINITAVRKAGGIEVNWKVPVENNIAGYQVERSQNGRSFNNVSSVTARGNSTAAVSYSWLDKQPVQGTGYYRIKASSLSGETKYSPVVKVTGNGKGSVLSLYPNPVKDVLNVLLASDVRGTYSVRVLDAKGVQVLAQSNLDAANNVLKINAAALGKGVYTLEVISADGNRETARFIK